MRQATILVIDDEPDMRTVLAMTLRNEGYRVLTAPSAERGLAVIRAKKPDVVVLDVMMPGMGGLELCRQLRQESPVPVLFLTGRGSEIDKVLGLKLGGDDYVTKPYSRDELVARIEALYRRSARALEPGRRPLEEGTLVIDLERREARLRGKRLELSPKEFDLLRVLIESQHRVLSREYLLRKVWGHPQGADLDTRTVDQHVARLRGKLGAGWARIETVPKSGYRLAAARYSARKRKAR